jgi:DNA-binding MarR family transcriptional regulator
MAALTTLDPCEQRIDFTRLRGLTGATERNLWARLDQLAPAGYVESTKAFVDRRPRATVKATAKGRAALARHVAFQKAIITSA